MKRSNKRRGAAFLIAALVILSRIPAVGPGALIFSCASDNDLNITGDGGTQVLTDATVTAAGRVYRISVQ